MKPFSFSLDAVLFVRAREEQAAAEAWALAVQAQTRAKEVWDAGIQELEDFHQLLEQKRCERFRPGDQEIYLYSIAGQKIRCEQLAAEYAKAVQFAKQRHAVLLEARMKHEVLTRLRQKKMNEYTRSVQAQEETAIQDLIIVRHGRGRGI